MRPNNNFSKNNSSNSNSNNNNNLRSTVQEGTITPSITQFGAHMVRWATAARHWLQRATQIRLLCRAARFGMAPPPPYAACGSPTCWTALLTMGNSHRLFCWVICIGVGRLSKKERGVAVP
jgi:hypothetical protein